MNPKFSEQVAAESYLLPDGSLVQFSPSTIKSWFQDYTRNGHLPRQEVSLSTVQRYVQNFPRGRGQRQEGVNLPWLHSTYSLSKPTIIGVGFTQVLSSLYTTPSLEAL